MGDEYTNKRNTNKNILELWSMISTQEFNSEETLRAIRAMYDGLRSHERDVSNYDEDLGNSQRVQNISQVNLHRTIVNLLVTRVLREPLSTKIVSAGASDKQQQNSKKVEHLINAIWRNNNADKTKHLLVEDAVVDGYAGLFFEHRPKFLALRSRHKKRLDFRITTTCREDLKFFYKDPMQMFIRRELVDRQTLMSLLEKRNKETKDDFESRVVNPIMEIDEIKDTYDSIYTYTKYTRNPDGTYDYITTVATNASATSNDEDDIMVDAGVVPVSPVSIFTPVFDKYRNVGLSIMLRNGNHIDNLNGIYSAFEEANQVLGVGIIGVDPSNKSGLEALTKAKGNRLKNMIVVQKSLGSKLDIQMPPLYDATTMALFNRLIALMYQENGVTEASAQGQKPKGLRTGAAIREATNLEQSVYTSIINNYKDTYTEFSTNIVRLIDNLMELKEFSKHTISVFTDEDTYQDIDWKDIDYDKNMYAMHTEPVAKIADTPEGRLEFASEIAKVYPLSAEGIVKLLSTPDVKGVIDIIMSGSIAVVEFIDRYIEGKENDISAGIDASTQYNKAREMYNKELSKEGDRDEERLKKLHDFIQKAKEAKMLEEQALALQQGSLTKQGA